NNIDGTGNNALGESALFVNIHASLNTAVGDEALFSNDSTGNGTAIRNTAVGAGALAGNNDGNSNTAVGSNALTSNTVSANTAVGAFALEVNTSGVLNTAVGTSALRNNLNGNANNVFGHHALTSNQHGIENNALGDLALQHNVDGHGNTAIGDGALQLSTTGNENTALGDDAGTAIVFDGNVCIGAIVHGVNGDNNKTRIRNIGSTPLVGATTVKIASTGGIGDQILGFDASSRRYKEGIKPMDKNSEKLFALKPVVYHGKGDATHVKLYGLIAEDVADVNPELAVYNEKGQPETVRYDSINAMLLNEFLKEHTGSVEEQRKVEKLEATVAQQHKDFEAVVNELKGQIQKVSAQLEMSKAAPQTVLNNQ